MPRKVPYTIRKKTGRPCYRVINRFTRKVFSKCTTKENAIKQDKLLRALMYNKTFKTYPSATRRNNQTRRRRNFYLR